ncbi:MAG TPA: carboxypeptidase regulatory-like domain-containing protein, partial [Gemmatimonadaceae bacterium]|nr:carboxypeptidase regulatory-like domain-containing protein [Gemmatimonadaceae bacterium]
MVRQSLAIRAAVLAACSLLPLGSLVAQAAQVVGRITDAATGAPLPAAAIRLVELHREARSHEDGRFTLGAVVPGTYQLTVQRIGYRSLSRLLEVRIGMDSLRLTMTASPLQLGATVVTGQVSERGAADAISPANVLSDAKLDRALDGTVAATIRGTPGVSMASMGPATARPVIRGLSGDRVLL